MKALTVRQPWAWLIIHGGKDVENRNWPTNIRGRVAIHAAKGMTAAEYGDALCFVEGFDPVLSSNIPPMDQLERGAIIGTINLHECATGSYSPWFQGPYGFMLSQPEAIKPVPVKGSLGFWEWMNAR